MVERAGEGGEGDGSREGGDRGRGQGWEAEACHAGQVRIGGGSSPILLMLYISGLGFCLLIHHILFRTLLQHTGLVVHTYVVI